MGWSLPVCCSRIGAAHLRRDQPCQDAAATALVRSGDGELVAVMAVADGHGHPRHRLSAEGSRLACAVAVEAVRSEIGSVSAALGEDPIGWELWLSEDLPVTIHAGWLAAIREDWERGVPPPGPAGDDFSPRLYGTTLGLVVMTSHWWGVTGIGDWDLLRLERDGSGSLVSEENPLAAPGESTFSLCMEEANEHFAERATLHALQAGEAGFRLLLSTDGVRKSCHSLEDFVLLAQHLSAAVDPGGGPAGGNPTADAPADARRLASELDRITCQGSGDDVSVAIGRWL